MKKVIAILSIAFVTIFAHPLFSQQIKKDTIQPHIVQKGLMYHQLYIGVGIGLDYGGLGGNILFYPHRNIGIFGGVGYTPVKTGYNAGIKFCFVPESSEGNFIPYASAMYGYNTVIYVEGDGKYNAMFYGYNFAAGMDLKFKTKFRHYFSTAVIIPVRGPEVNDYINELNRNHHIRIQQELWPILISFGFKLNI